MYLYGGNGITGQSDILRIKSIWSMLEKLFLCYNQPVYNSNLFGYFLHAQCLA